MDKPSTSGKSRVRPLRLLVLLALVIACILPGTPGTPAAPTPALQFTDHILVSLTDPQDGDSYPISAGLSVRAEAISDGSIARMELWADGVLVEEYAAPEVGLGYLVHYFNWSPAALGVHTLIVRAYNFQDQESFSDAIRIQGIEDPGLVVIAQAQEGDTLSSIADRYSLTQEDLVHANPNYAGAAALSAGDEIFVHIGAPVPASDPSMAAKVLMRFNQWTSESQYGSLGASASVPPPTLNVIGQGCNATLAITEASTAELGFNIYRLDPGARSFSKLMTMPAHAGGDTFSQADPNLFGLYHYYVTAFDDSGEAASNLVSLNITDSNCSGKPVTLDDLASLPAGVEDYYLYVSLNSGNWRRFPADEFTFLKKSQGIDFGQVAKSLAPNEVGDISMKGEVWSMLNGVAALLGTFDKSFKTGQAPPAMLQPFSFQVLLSTQLEARGIPILDSNKYAWHTEKNTTYGPETFRFGTDANATYGIWQVASVPFQPEASFAPACLLLAGKTNGSGTPDSPYEFGIDFSQLKPKIESVQLSPFENSLEQTPLFFQPFSPGKMDTSYQQAVTQPKWGAGAFGFEGGSPVVTSFDPCAQNMSAEGAITYFVRLIPMNNGQAAGSPSNIVKLTYDPNGQFKFTFPAPPPIPPGTYYDVKILNFTGVHVPDPLYEFCVEIVENNNLLYPHKPGEKVCPEKFQGGSKNDLLGAIEDAFNFIAGVYNKLSDWATKLVEQLNPLCIQAKMVSSAVKVGEKEVKDACHYIAVIAVTAAKTYVGLPPSIPEFDKLTDLGKQNLVELAAQELEAQGIPCPEDCKNVIRKGLDYSLEQAKQNMTNSSCLSEQNAHDNGIEPLCMPPGVTSKPDPRGQPAPAVAEVQVTRRPGTTGTDFPEPVSCNATVSVYAKNGSHVGESYTTVAGFHWQGSPIEGNLLSGAGAFPNLQPGGSTKLPIVLSPESFWLAGHKEFVQKGWEPEDYDDWYILYKGAQATVSGGGLCKFVFPEGTGFSSSAVQGDSLQVGPLGNAWMQTCNPYNCP